MVGEDGYEDGFVCTYCPPSMVNRDTNEPYASEREAIESLERDLTSTTFDKALWEIFHADIDFILGNDSPLGGAFKFLHGTHGTSSKCDTFSRTAFHPVESIEFVLRRCAAGANSALLISAWCGATTRESPR